MAGMPRYKAMLAAVEVLAGATGEQAIDDWFVEQIEGGATGGQLADAVRAVDPEAAGVQRIYKWLGRNPDIEARVSRARKASAHAFADKAADVADKVSEANARASAVKLKGYQWQAEKRNRDEYGEAKVNVTNNLDIGSVYLQVLRVANGPGPLTNGNDEATQAGRVIDAQSAIDPPPSAQAAGVEENTGYPTSTTTPSPEKPEEPPSSSGPASEES